jgi:hypothetical protein
MAELAAFIIIYYGGFLLATICACFAIRKATKRKTAKLLLIAAIVLVLAQVALWELIVSSGNGV